MSRIRYGCQTYPWKMNQSQFQGNMPHMVQVAAQAGFTGIEAEIDMLGQYFNHPEQLEQVLEQNQMQLAALVLHQPWRFLEETEEERVLTEKAIRFAAYFPRTKIMLSHHAGEEDRGTGQQLLQRRKNLISCMGSVSQRAGEQGIVCCYHPNSGKNSLFRTEEDYRVLFQLLENTDIGYAPDIGHIVNGGMQPLQVLREHRDKIRHVHFKDRLGQSQWAVMGEGTIDYPAIVEYLEQTGYAGWIMVEDESPKALENSDNVVLADGDYMSRFWGKGGTPWNGIQ